MIVHAPEGFWWFNELKSQTTSKRFGSFVPVTNKQSAPQTKSAEAVLTQTSQARPELDGSSIVIVFRFSFILLLTSAN